MSGELESVVTFRAGTETLLGIVHRPRETPDTGVLILVGGPQYRVGSHRMFVQIGRALARAGVATFRFDFTGMGDSTGTFPGFDRLDRDIGAALDAFAAHCPSAQRLVLLGLCDGASAAACYLGHDPRVAAAVLLNPWVHTQAGEAKALLWHYYPRRLLQLAFWQGLLNGNVSVGLSFRDLLAKFRTIVGEEGDSVALLPGGFVERMRAGLAAFRGPVLVAASENDLTAAEFVDLWNTDKRWRYVRNAASFLRLPGADHTLSGRANLEGFCSAVCAWLSESWSPDRSS